MTDHANELRRYSRKIGHPAGDVPSVMLAAADEIERLRAKIAEMEQQEPARLVTATAYRWRYRGAVKWQYGELTEETARLAKEHNHEVQPLYALPGAQAQNAPSVPSEEDESVRKAWSRFSNELHRSPDAPYPGMSEAFEQHFSQSFTDRDWRAESGTWAAAWKAAKRHGAQAQPALSVPDGWKLVPIEVIYLYSFMCAAFVPMTPQQEQIAVQLELAKRAMLAAAPKPEGE